MVQFINSVEEIDLSSIFVCVEQDENYPGQLVFQVLVDQGPFTTKYSSFLTRFNVLRDTGLWGHFSEELERDGYSVYALPSADEVLRNYETLSQDLKIKDFKIPGGDLHWYQKYGLQSALEKVYSSPAHVSLFFFNYGTGAGKTACAAALSQELLNRGEVDVVIVCTVSMMKTNLQREFARFTNLNVCKNDGSRVLRRTRYLDDTVDVFVMNYEKMHWDYQSLENLVRQRSVLFIFDEVQKILTVSQNNKPNQARQGADKLIAAARHAVVAPMSASVVKQTPERYWRTFDFLSPNPLGTRKEFRTRYIEYSTPPRWKKLPSGQVRYIPPKDVWNLSALEDVPHRIAPWTHSVRKDDPGVRELFKETQFIPFPVEMGKEDRKLYDFVLNAGETDLPAKADMSAIQIISCLQYICNTSEAFLHTENQLASYIVENYTKFSFDSENSSKLLALVELIEQVRDQGDQCIVFTHWTNLSLFPISRILEKAGIRHVNHHGGNNPKVNQKAQDDFKRNKDISVFLSSDAGSQGLSFQNARYVINYEIPYNYDDLLQRNSRIDRADSYLDGLTMYALYNENTVEERIWAINNFRRRMAAAVQGTTESLQRSAAEENYSDDQLEKASAKFILTGHS